MDLMLGHGWKYGADFTFVEADIPFSPDIEAAARRVVAEKPDLIFVANSAAALAVHRLDSKTPIVMYASGYPVAAGLAHSLSHPGKNVTGNAVYAGAGIWGKLLQLLRDTKTGTRRIGLLWGYTPPMFLHQEIEYGMVELRADARNLGLDIRFFDVKTLDEVDSALQALEAWQPQAALITGGPYLSPRLTDVMETVNKQRIPSIADYHSPVDVEFGPLVTYAPPLSELRQKTIAYVDRIMRGARAGDLPIQQPSRFELVLNQRTARAIGLSLPRSLLLRADRVIE